MTFTSLDISAFDDPDYALNFRSEFKDGISCVGLSAEAELRLHALS
eukprot:gene5770-6960_t